MKVFLKSTKIDLHAFGFFAIFLVGKLFNKYIIRYKIKFHAEVV
jgi:hypothetical protein